MNSRPITKPHTLLVQRSRCHYGIARPWREAFFFVIFLLRICPVVVLSSVSRCVCRLAVWPRCSFPMTTPCTLSETTAWGSSVISSPRKLHRVAAQLLKQFKTKRCWWNININVVWRPIFLDQLWSEAKVLQKKLNCNHIEPRPRSVSKGSWSSSFLMFLIEGSSVLSKSSKQHQTSKWRWNKT